MNAIGALLQNPVLALVVTTVALALALSGHFSVIASQCLLVATLVVAIIGLRAQPWPVLIGGSISIAGGLLLLGYWFRPDVIPAYSGVLAPQATLLFSSEGGGTIFNIEIGQSGTFIRVGDDENLNLLPLLRETQFRVENVGGKIKVSSQIFDREGHLIVELVRNEWKVAPSPRTWDRNYTDDALEVRDGRGLVVLQVRALIDCIQIQGLWWIDTGPPKGIVQLILAGGISGRWGTSINSLKADCRCRCAANNTNI